MRIRRVRIQNFQSHRDTTMELDPGVNVIVGPSDNGKSAVVRALRWAMRNRAGGDFVNAAAREAGEPCVVGLAMESGDGGERRVVRRRDRDTNYYAIIDGEDRREFTGFGREVPGPVAEVVGGPVSFGRDLSYDLSFSTQGEAHFLVGGDPRSLARVLGRLTGIDVLDAAEQLVGTEDRSRAGRLRTLSEERARVAAELAGVPDTKLARHLVVVVEAASASGELGRRTIGVLRASSDSLRATSARATGARRELDSLAARLGPLDTSHTALREVGGALSSLTRARDAAQSCLRRLEVARAREERMGLAITPLDQTLQRLDALGRELQPIRELRDALGATRRARDGRGSRLASATVVEADLSARETMILELRAIRARLAGILSDAGPLAAKRASLAEMGAELDRESRGLSSLLVATEVCPLSGGKLFESCKQLMGRTG